MIQAGTRPFLSTRLYPVSVAACIRQRSSVGSAFRRTIRALSAIRYPRLCLGPGRHLGSGGGALACPLANRSIVSLTLIVESGRT